MQRTTHAAVLIALAGCFSPAIAADGMTVKASELIGKETRNSDGAGLGRIQDLVVDLDDSRVRYAIIGGRGKLHRYSLAQLELMTGKEHVLFDIPQQRLEASPGMAPGWKAGAGLVRASELIGWKVRDAQGQSVGEITEILIDAGDGTVPFALVDLAGDAGRGTRLRLDALRLRGDELVLAR